MIDGTPPEAEWNEMSVAEVQRWAWSLRTWKRAMRQDTPVSALMRKRYERTKRNIEASSATVDVEDYR
jgi:hypothetical protein